MAVTPTEFIDAVFCDAGEAEEICVSLGFIPKDDPANMAFQNMPEDHRRFAKWKPETQARAFYYSVCTVNGDKSDKGNLRRGRKNLLRYHVLVLDDIGDKTGEPLVEPSYKLESSPGSYQWGYCLQPNDDLDRYEALVRAIHELGYGDAGAGGNYRVMRVPGSANLKPGKDEFRSRITFWEPDVVWTLAELAGDFGLDIDALPVAPTKGPKMLAGGAEVSANIDPVLHWLADTDRVVKDNGDWVDVVCPWADKHTTGSSTAGYSPLGRGDDDWVQTRAFKCLHEHCRKRGFADFSEWVIKEGGPVASGYDPLPWLQDRYTYIGMGQQVADMHQRKQGGEWLWELRDWTVMNPGRISVPGEDKPIPVAKAFVTSRDTTKADYMKYLPQPKHRETGVINLYGQNVLNTYRSPNWVETDKEPEAFLRHVDYLIPKAEERETFLNWMAYKIQNPDKRSFAIIMVAEGEFGTGRSWLNKMLSVMLHGEVNTATLGQLIGKGTPSEQNYNDWMAGCQFLVIEEAKDTGLSVSDFYHCYENFKQNVDPAVLTDVRINPKYGRTRTENIYYNALIFSNHSDAIALPAGDRRCYVIDNPKERQTEQYYKELYDCLQNGEPGRLYWYLLNRDVGDFSPVYPRDTEAKARMIAENQPPSELIAEMLAEKHPTDLVTLKSLKAAVVMAARVSELDKTAMQPEAVTRMIWKKLGSLKPDDRNGFRFTYEGEQVSVRALRNFSEWISAAALNEVDKAREEFSKGENLGISRIVP